MYGPRFRLRSFDALSVAERETVERLMLEALITANIAWLRAHPNAPALYESGVVYAADQGEDHWSDIPETLRLGSGDCKDFAAWRIAELREREHEVALPRFAIAQQGSLVLYHVTVRREDGREEDPSRILGMP